MIKTWQNEVKTTPPAMQNREKSAKIVAFLPSLASKNMQKPLFPMIFSKAKNARKWHKISASRPFWAKNVRFDARCLTQRSPIFDPKIAYLWPKDGLSLSEEATLVFSSFSQILCNFALYLSPTKRKQNENEPTQQQNETTDRHTAAALPRPTGHNIRNSEVYHRQPG